jgi:hypothetical protein
MAMASRGILWLKMIGPRNQRLTHGPILLTPRKYYVPVEKVIALVLEHGNGTSPINRVSNEKTIELNGTLLKYLCLFTGVVISF